MQPEARLLYQGCWKGKGTRSVHAAPYDLVIKFLMACVKQEVLSSLNKISFRCISARLSLFSILRLQPSIGNVVSAMLRLS